jgi:hypothetical protein
MNENIKSQIRGIKKSVSTISWKTSQFEEISRLINEDLTVSIPESTSINSYCYNRRTRQLFVQFKPNTDNVYKYLNVDLIKFDNLDRALSKGKYILREIKGKHAFKRMSITSF